MNQISDNKEILDRNSIYQIDIASVIAAKTSRKLPAWLIRYVTKIVHQKEINECILHAKHPVGSGFFMEALNYLDITFEVRGIELLPKPDHKCIFACNHPLGGPEGLILGEMMHRYYGDKFQVPVNDILGHFPPLADFFVPVNVLSSKQTRDVGERMSQMFESDNQVLVFPSGKCARKEHGKITEQPWKKMFITQARRYNRDIVPIHFSGLNSKRYYFLTSFSKAIGLKFNIGMIYLVDELFKQKHKKFVITIGEIIPCSMLDKSKTDPEWAEYIKNKVKILGQSNGELPNM